MKRKKIWVSASVIIVILAAFLIGYYGYYVKTPTYTLSTIKTAVEKHDWETFSKHVDMDSVSSSAFDGVMAYSLEKSGDDTMNALATEFVKLMKPGIVYQMNENIKQYVLTGSFQDDVDMQSDKSVAAADNFKKQANFKHLAYKGIAYTNKEDKLAVVGIKLHDEQVNKDFVLDLKMRELEDGSWKVMALSNLKEYLLEEEKARTEKLAELNKPVLEKITGIVTVGNVTAQLVPGDPFGFSKKLQVVVPITIKGSKAVAMVHGVIDVYNQADKVLFQQNFSADMTGAGNTEKRFDITSDLNPFIGNQNKIVKAGVNGVKITCSITAVEYADGTKVEMLKELPDKEMK